MKNMTVFPNKVSYLFFQLADGKPLKTLNPSFSLKPTKDGEAHLENGGGPGGATVRLIKFRLFIGGKVKNGK